MTPKFFSDMTMIFYFKIAFNKITITYPNFCRVFKIFIIFFNLDNLDRFFINIFFITWLQYLLSLIMLMINVWAASWPKSDLINKIYDQYTIIYNQIFNQHDFDMYLYKTYLSFAFWVFQLFSGTKILFKST